MARHCQAVDRSTLDIIIADAREFLATLEAVGLEGAGTIMMQVVEQLGRDRMAVPLRNDEGAGV